MDFSEIDQLPAALQAVATYQHFSSGQILFQRHEEVRAIYAIKSGQVRLLHYTSTGQAISHYTVQDGEICAEVALFMDTYACSAVVETSTQVLAFPKQTFLNTVQQNSDFTIAVMHQLSHRLHNTKIMVELRSIRSTQERVLHYLQLIVSPEKNTIILPKPLKSIATDLGISPEGLSRALTQLEGNGIISRKRRNIILL
jgi:CRP-like cAMP-binding protein